MRADDFGKIDELGEIDLSLGGYGFDDRAVGARQLERHHLHQRAEEIARLVGERNQRAAVLELGLDVVLVPLPALDAADIEPEK